MFGQGPEGSIDTSGTRQAALAGLIAALFVLAACAGPSDAPEELDRVWSETLVDVRGQPPMSVSALPRVPPRGESRMPAVVYLHGCGGRGHTALSHIRLFKRQGYAVFAPDHRSRPDAQVLRCDGDAAGRFAGPEVNRLRHAEARRVRLGLRRLGWIDQERVVLVGHGQGANAAASYPHEGHFAKIVAIAGDCRFGVQSHAPLLTVAARNDESHARSQRRCRRFSGPNLEHLTVAGGDHDFILDAAALAPPDEQARDTILEFLARQDEGGGIKLRIGG